MFSSTSRRYWLFSTSDSLERRAGKLHKTILNPSSISTHITPCSTTLSWEGELGVMDTDTTETFCSLLSLSDFYSDYIGGSLPLSSRWYLSLVCYAMLSGSCAGGATILALYTLVMLEERYSASAGPRWDLYAAPLIMYAWLLLGLLIGQRPEVRWVFMLGMIYPWASLAFALSC